MNTTIADKIMRSESLPQNLQQCFEKALRLEDSPQLPEGINMAQRTMVMDINLEGDEEINLIKDARATPNAVTNVEKWDISKEIANMMGTNPLTVNKHKEANQL